MSKRTRSGRVKGYHYALDSTGRRYRVYPNTKSAARRAAPAPRRVRRTTHPAYKRRPSARQLVGTTDYLGDTIMGYGAYRMRRGSLRTTSSRAIREPGIPRIQNSTNGVIIRHKEFLTDVPSSVGFTGVVVPLNPGMDVTFPWLSRVAQNFEEWLPRGIVVEYRTTSSDTLLAANPALGSVIIATQYNSVNPDFTNKQQMENYEGAISCKPSVSMIHQVETHKSQNVQGEYYVRVEAPPANADLRMYDLGKVQISTVGSQTNGNIIGEIWISYEIELRKPKIPADPIVDAAHFLLPAGTLTAESPAIPAGTNAPSNQAGVAAGAGVQPFGGWLPTSGSTMNDARFNRNAALFGGASYIQLGQFSRGNYLITCFFPFATPGTQGAWTITAQSGCTLGLAFANGTLLADTEVDAATVTAATINCAFVINVTAAFATVSLTNSSNQAGGFNVGGDIYITELPDGILVP